MMIQIIFTKKPLGFLLSFLFLITMPSLSYGLCPVTLKWNKNQVTPDGYRIFIHEKGQEYDYLNPDWDGEANQATIPDLEEGKTYYTVVRAYAGELESRNSNQITYTFKEDCTIINANFPWNLIIPTIVREQ